MTSTRFLITGANGFVGTVLCDRLRENGSHLVLVQRRENAGGTSATTWVRAESDFRGLAEAWPADVQCDVAVHLAARVHVMNESSIDALPRYRETNVAGSLRVVEAAFRAGAKRFVYVSSVKALGDLEPGSPARPWREDDLPHPNDPYGQSKLEAERAIQRVCEEKGMVWVVLRPPLVYGAGVKANFQQLLSLVARGVPLPIATVKAKRSLVYVDNLVDAILHCLTHPKAANHCFHVSDGIDLSVAEMVTTLGQGIGRPARLFAVPAGFLSWAARLAGRTQQADRILSPLRLDTERIQTRLGWVAPVAINDALGRTARSYRQSFTSRPS